MTTKQLREFLLWLRKERISYTHITAGGVTLDGVVDGKRINPPAKIEPRVSMYEAYAGELAKVPLVPTDEVPDEAKVDD